MIFMFLVCFPPFIMQFICPGMWLTDVTRNRYEVREKKCPKKVYILNKLCIKLPNDLVRICSLFTQLLVLYLGHGWGGKLVLEK
jgi:hypothetical protein